MELNLFYALKLFGQWLVMGKISTLNSSAFVLGNFVLLEELVSSRLFLIDSYEAMFTVSQTEDV